MDPTKITDFLKLSSEQLLGLLVFCTLVLGFVTLGADQVLEPLGLDGFRKDYLPWLGIGFVLSASLLLVRLLFLVSRWVLSKITQRRRIKTMRTRLHGLTPGEKQVLRKFFTNNSITSDFSLSDGVAQRLVFERILFRTPNTQGSAYSFPHNIQPWAWNYLQEHPELLTGEGPS